MKHDQILSEIETLTRALSITDPSGCGKSPKINKRIGVLVDMLSELNPGKQIEEKAG